MNRSRPIPLYIFHTSPSTCTLHLPKIIGIFTSPSAVTTAGTPLACSPISYKTHPTPHMYPAKDDSYLIITFKPVPGDGVLTLNAVVYLAIHATSQHVIGLAVKTTRNAPWKACEEFNKDDVGPSAWSERREWKDGKKLMHAEVTMKGVRVWRHWFVAEMVLDKVWEKDVGVA